MSASAPIHLFWDSCVFIRYLTENPGDFVGDISQYLNDAKEGKVRIYTSTIALAEIRPRHLANKGIGSFQEFIDDFQGAINMISAPPHILTEVGRIRDFEYKKQDGTRTLGTPDAIMLLSCLHLIDDYGVQIDAFHSFDEGKRRGPDGKGVPVIGFHEWASHILDDTVQRICQLNRCKPAHSEPSIV